MARPVLNGTSVNNLLLARAKTLADDPAYFWPRLLGDSSMQNCSNLEKLLAGCEIIAALDDLGLLLAVSDEAADRAEPVSPELVQG